MDVLFVCVLSFEMRQINFLLLKVLSVALGQVKALSQSLHSPGAVAAITLEVAVPQSMLQLHVSDHSEHCNLPKYFVEKCVH
jgi:hypothetical protein